MSFFEGKTKEQIARATDAEVSAIVNLICAERGIPIFLEDIGDEPKPIVEPDKEYFTVSGWTFSTREQAEAIQTAALAGQRWKRGYDRRYRETPQAVPCDAAISISSVKLYSPEQWHKYQSELTGFESRKTAYAEAKKRADSAAEKRTDVSNEVWREVWTAMEEVNEAARIDRLFEKYITLANGDREIARRFLIAAEKFDEAWQPKPAEAPEGMPF